MGTRASARGRALGSSRRRRLATVLLAVSAPALAACGANFDAQTNQVYQPALGVNDRSGDVFVINAVVVTDGSGNGTVSGSLINQATEDDRLVEVKATTPIGAALDSSDLGVGISLPPGESIKLAEGAKVRVSATAESAPQETAGGEDVAGGVTPGGFVTLQFIFERAPVVELLVPVIDQDTPANEMYSDVPIRPAVPGSAR